LYGLVNNAGVGTFKPIVDLSLAEFEETLKTNLTGSFLCMREAARRMKSKGGGRIIQIGSISDHLTLPENGAYAASKFGTRALVGVLNEELKHHGVHCSLVSPGATLTEIWQGRSGFDPNDMISPDDIATTVTDILMRPKGVRIDEVKILPSKGVL
jgi:short-subunit dehydrogenase